MVGAGPHRLGRRTRCRQRLLPINLTKSSGIILNEGHAQFQIPGASRPAQLQLHSEDGRSTYGGFGRSTDRRLATGLLVSRRGLGSRIKNLLVHQEHSLPAPVPWLCSPHSPLEAP